MLIFTKSLRVCLAVEPCDLRAMEAAYCFHVDLEYPSRSSRCRKAVR